jgi:hypothetical protein
MENCLSVYWEINVSSLTLEAHLFAVLLAPFSKHTLKVRGTDPPDVTDISERKERDNAETYTEKPASLRH